MAEVYEPSKDKFDVFQGATLRRTYQWLIDEVATGLSVYPTIRSQFRWSHSDTATVFDLTEANGGIVRTNNSNGEFQIHIDAELSTAIVPDSSCDPNVSKWPMVFDIELVHTDVDVIRLVYGTATFHREATR